MRSLRNNIKYYITGNVGVLLLTWLLYGIGNAITMPYLSIYMKMLGANSVEIGITYSIAISAQLMTIIPGGYLTDTIGRRKSIVIGTWLITITSFLMAIAPNWQSLIAIYAINMAAAFYQPALSAIIIDSLPQERYASGILITSVLPQIPWLILPPIGGLLINKYGLLGIRLAYIISAFISIAVAVIRQFTLKETLRNNNEKISFREVLHSYYSLSDIVNLPNDVVRIYIIALLLTISVMPANTLLSVFAVYRLGLSTVYWGYFVSVSYAAYIVIGILLTFYVDRLRRWLMLLGSVINILGSAVGLFENVLTAMFYLILLQVGSQLIMTELQSGLGRLVKIDRRGYGFSFFIVFQLVGQIIGGYLSGALYSISTYTLFLTPLILSLMILILHI
ncbi:MAG: MFS transporter [Vulcanisaeta sp. AZ3]